MSEFVDLPEHANTSFLLLFGSLDIWPFPPGGTFSIGETHKSWQREYLWEQRGSSVQLRDPVEINNNMINGNDV